jgi:hypothetical protein
MAILIDGSPRQFVSAVAKPCPFSDEAGDDRPDEPNRFDRCDALVV